MEYSAEGSGAPAFGVGSVGGRSYSSWRVDGGLARAGRASSAVVATSRRDDHASDGRSAGQWTRVDLRADAAGELGVEGLNALMDALHGRMSGPGATTEALEEVAGARGREAVGGAKSDVARRRTNLRHASLNLLARVRRVVT